MKTSANALDHMDAILERIQGNLDLLIARYEAKLPPPMSRAECEALLFKVGDAIRKQEALARNARKN